MSRTLTLARTLFRRLFETDLMPPGLPQVQLVIWSVAFLAMPGLVLPIRFAGKYTQLQNNPVALAQAVLVDQLLFITLSMTAIGVVALAIWDGIFPDRRDARILGALPLSDRMLVSARLLALGALCGIFLIGINVVPTIIFGSTIAIFGAASSFVRGIVAHFLATVLAGTFVFAALIALQGIVLNAGGRRAADRLSVILQIVFVTTLLQMIFFMPRLGRILPLDLQGLWLKAIPSVWFLGLYDVVGGRPASGSWSLALVAILAVFASIALAIALFAATHPRLSRLALESQGAAAPAPHSIRRLIRRLPQRISRQPVSLAVLEFTLRTLVRSRSHRLLVSMYLGLALALVASALVPLLANRGLAGFERPSIEVLSAPLVLGFLAMLGIRVAVAIPVEPRANWIVRLREPADRVAATDGVRNAMLLVGVIPSALLGMVSAGALWGFWPALVQGVVCAVMGWLLVEILLLWFGKIPFTCTYFPGASRIGTFWPLYLTGFITYSYSVAAWTQHGLARPIRLAAFLAVVGLSIVLLTIWRHRYVTELRGLRFQEEDPATLFEGFHLSEGFAATSEDTRRLR